MWNQRGVSNVEALAHYTNNSCPKKEIAFNLREFSIVRDSWRIWTYYEILQDLMRYWKGFQKKTAAWNKHSQERILKYFTSSPEGPPTPEPALTMCHKKSFDEKRKRMELGWYTFKIFENNHMSYSDFAFSCPTQGSRHKEDPVAMYNTKPKILHFKRLNLYEGCAVQS